MTSIWFLSSICVQAVVEGRIIARNFESVALGCGLFLFFVSPACGMVHLLSMQSCVAQMTFV